MDRKYNIILICPSEYWSTIERTALRDGKILTSEGHQVFYYLLQDSHLDLKVKSYGMKAFYHQGRMSTSLLQWTRLRSIPTIIEQNEIEIVQCYDLHMLWPISFFLRKKSLVPLIFSHNVEIQKVYHNFWYRPLIARIDMTLLPNKEMIEGVVGSLRIPAHKIDFCGLGVGEERLYEEETNQPTSGHFLENFNEDWLLGCYVGAHEDNIEYLKPLFQALAVLREQRPNDRGVKLVLISDKAWDQHLLTTEIGNYLVDTGLDQDVLFESKTPVIKVQRWMDLWIGLRSFEAIEDYTVTSLLGGIPVVMTRSTASIELLRQYPKIAETYKRNDSRELRCKIMDLMSNFKDSQKALKMAYSDLVKQFGVTTYKEQLLHVYDKSVEKRSRFYRARNP